MSEYSGIPFHELLKQPPEIQSVCSACSAYNWLKLAGASITQQDGDVLMQQVVDTRSPLSDDQVKGLADRFGFDVDHLAGQEGRATVDDFMGRLVPVLERSPILFTMSTHLSKKDRSVVPSMTYRDMEGYTSQLVTHAAVCVKDPLTPVAFIIDPYDPQNPERFDTTAEPDRLELTSWMMSSFFQFLAERKQMATKENILSYAREVLSDPDRVARGDIHIFGMMQAGPMYLVPKE